MKKMLIAVICLIVSNAYYNVSIGQVSPKSKTAKPAPAKKASTKATGSTAMKPITISMSVVPDVMQFDKKSFTVKAGQKVTIELENPDGMQHNLVLIKAGALDKVGMAADDMARDPKGAEKSYVPGLPEVLYATKLLNPQESATLQFTAPSQPGEYPYVCTFPGHWRIMRGVMKVVK
ncbi:MAG: plastocyanin/azurin family copper-binding protein [Chitinophagaceae bacterium]